MVKEVSIVWNARRKTIAAPQSLLDSIPEGEFSLIKVTFEVTK
jgi:hypothetical protein